MHSAHDWRDSAACQGADLDLFFGTGYDETDKARDKREAKAKKICAGCPVRDACLNWALNTGIAYGVWGGFGEDERRTYHTVQRRIARKADAA